jgi:polyisoprenoid-binding protein YceI
MRPIFTFFLILVLALSGCSSLVSTINVPTATPAPVSTQILVTGPTPTLSLNTVPYKIVPGESQASYQVEETFLNQNNKLNTAIGVTTQVTGDIFGNTADPTQSRIGTISVDISLFTSNSAQRDNFIRKNFLQSSQYPLATFTPTSVDGLPTSYVDGQDYTFKVSGNLTVHTVTKPVTWDMTARLTGNTLTGLATTTVKMSDFGVGPITLAGILQTQDDVKLTLNFVARPG